MDSQLVVLPGKLLEPALNDSDYAGNALKTVAAWLERRKSGHPRPF
jgi:hypothetical protein